MKLQNRSIRFRLWSAAAVSIVVALLIAAVGLRYLFERHVERRVEEDMAVALQQLVGATGSAAGVLTVGPVLTDPRYETPLSGHYWQVEDIASGALTRSRSLWDGALVVPPQPAGGALHVGEITGPDGELLIAVDRTISDAGGQSFRVIVAEPHSSIEASVGQYIAELVPALALLGGVLIAAIFVQITVGLAPLEALRAAVRDVVARRRARLDVAAPREVQPLAEEINNLLDAQGKALARARLRATDLAHGLKTPLHVLFADIRALRGRGDEAVADGLLESATAIRRHVERELARARVATDLAPGIAERATSSPAKTIADVISVVRRTPEGERLEFMVNAPAALTAPIDDGDLAELLGNLVENAARYARSAIRVDVAGAAAGTTITVSDDGPGLAEADREAVLSRGVSMNGGGSGLGLAIVSDIVDAYGGRLTLGDARPGLTVTIFLPAPA